MKKILSIIALGSLFTASHLKAQVVLEALDAPNGKCLERVYDKYYGDGVHNYIYCAVQGPNGKKWLNLNLGAEYAKESSPHFNPEAVPTDYNDWKAFGNLYQWGRDSDGHEQVEYRQGSDVWEFRPVNGVRTTVLGPGETSNQMVRGEPNTYYTSSDLGNYWIHDPCPEGYRVMTINNLFSLGALSVLSGNHYSASIFGNKILYPNLKLVTAPYGFSIIGEGWYNGDASLGGLNSGSSQLWLNEKHGKRYSYIAGALTWEILNIPGSFYHSMIVDRGFYKEKDYGITNAHALEPRAVRCVEK